MKSFSDHAYDKMLDLYNNHSHEVGTEIASLHPGKTPTNCIIYVVNVLKYAFEKIGDKASAKKVPKLIKYGTDLAAYLVNEHHFNEHHWKGVYINPDINHPRDGHEEHPYSYFRKVLLSNKYYKIPISHLVINYKPTLKTNGNYRSFAGLGGSKDSTKVNEAQLEALKNVKFGMGLYWGGDHTWLYSYGKVYEVHWSKIGADLYEVTNLEDYAALSGAIVIPPDAFSAFFADEFSTIWISIMNQFKSVAK